MIDLDGLLEGFVAAAADCGIAVPSSIRVDRVAGPHESPSLPPGWGAIYIFSLTEAYGAGCDAGSGRVLKVGKAGPSSNPRFQYQHYSPKSARSSLARSLLTHRVLWPYLGISSLDDGNVGTWIRRNTDRHHLFVPGDEYPVVAPSLETYARGVLGSVFEGSA